MFAIKKKREEAGLTQQEVADKLGIKKPRYGDWERETREINLRDAIRLADLFECTLDELAGRTWERPDYADPAQAELNDCWCEIDATRRSALLVQARDARAAMRGGNADAVSDAGSLAV